MQLRFDIILYRDLPFSQSLAVFSSSELVFLQRIHHRVSQAQAGTP